MEESLGQAVLHREPTLAWLVVGADEHDAVARFGEGLGQGLRDAGMRLPGAGGSNGHDVGARVVFQDRGTDAAYGGVEGSAVLLAP